MACTPEQMYQLCKTLDEHQAMPDLLSRMSLTYWHEFRTGDGREKENAALKQDMLEDWMGEINAVLTAKKLDGREST